MYKYRVQPVKMRPCCANYCKLPFCISSGSLTYSCLIELSQLLGCLCSWVYAIKHITERNGIEYFELVARMCMMLNILYASSLPFRSITIALPASFNENSQKHHPTPKHAHRILGPYASPQLINPLPLTKKPRRQLNIPSRPFDDHQLLYPFCVIFLFTINTTHPRPHSPIGSNAIIGLYL
ncbi:hypothetical protein L211DRAFT_544697 [Terfezia boudieri ATCC MYA-4762]|uniref:Uncharacterized protein n=1 Tax=Terfezia boudieri ATCC MYA-4762 TaxID=1051890 RepID=A0A3N4MDW9_9PEZI|nr:hypothetical protein L211DRAFT_544697 [Terfezia boudieri ATCC MYA-4762]